MTRIVRGPIDMLGGYTLLDSTGQPPQDDYYQTTIGGPGAYSNVTIWGRGLISFGPPTDAQKAWMASLSAGSDIATFPGDWVAFGFSATQSWGPIEILRNGQYADGLWLEGVRITSQGVFGGPWSIDGQTSSASNPTFYWSELTVIEGSAASETLTGTATPETLRGEGGDDLLDGGDGSDALHGGAGNDVLIGGGGNDRLFGGEGDDRLDPGSEFAAGFLNGTSGDHRLVGSVDGGAGHDTLVLDYSASTRSVVLTADALFSTPTVAGMEAVAITGSQYNDVVTGSASADRLAGGGGFDVLRGGGGDDWIDAGAPSASAVGVIQNGGSSPATAPSLDHLFTPGVRGPQLSFSVTSTPTSVLNWGLYPSAGTTYSFSVDQPGATLWVDYSVPYFGTGVTYAFAITGPGGAVEWYPWVPGQPITLPDSGTYFFQAIVGNSNVWDTATLNVTLSLSSANILTGNMLYGGAGNDTFVVHAATDQVIELAGEGIDTVRSSVTYSLSANVENLTLTGADAISGFGNALDNLIVGNAGDNAIDGGAGNDVLLGGGGNDRLTGGTGNDLLGGGAGGDVLTGGADKDLFLFTRSELGSSKAGWHDTVTDFVRGEKIDVSALYDGVTFGGLKAGKASDAATLSGFKAVYFVEGGITYLVGDTDGIAGADFAIAFTGVHRFSAGDLIVGKSAVREWSMAAGGLDYATFHDDISGAALTSMVFDRADLFLVA